MSESIGTRLRDAREKRQLSLQQASDTTKVRIHYLQALENDDLSAMPSTAQARGFLRIYAEFLGLGESDLVPPVIASTPAAAIIDEPKTQPKPGATTQATTAAAGPAGPALLDKARALLKRFGKPEVAAPTGPTLPAQTPSNPATSAEPSIARSESPKKKLTN